MKLMIIDIVIVLTITITLYITILLVLANKKSVEEEYIAEIRTVSPASKIIGLILKKMFSSLGAMLIVISLYIIAIMSAFIASYMYTSMVIDMSGYPSFYNFIGTSNSIGNTEYINTSRSITIIQLYNPITLYNVNLTLYPLIIYCGKDIINFQNNVPGGFLKICNLIQGENNSIILDSKIRLPLTSLYIDDQLFNIKYANLSYITDIDIAPGLPLVHSIGSLGGTILKIENSSMIAVISTSLDNIKKLCKDECNAKSIIISNIDISEAQKNLTEYLSYFDIVILRLDGRGYVYSNNVIPSPITIAGMSIMFINSIIISLSVSGALLEKLIDLGQRLMTVGITSEFYNAIVSASMVTFFAISGLPIIILGALGSFNSMGLLAYILMSIGNTLLFSYMTKTRLEKVGRGYGETALTYIGGPINVETMKKCFTGNIANDEFFNLGEIELIREKGTYIIRVELLYRRAVATLVSVEIYIRSVNNSTTFNILADVWSLEELSGRIAQGVIQLALSKVYGALKICVENLS